MLLARGSAGIAGYDLLSARNCVIPSQSKGTIKIGFAVSLPPGTYGQIAPYSGLVIRNFIDARAGVVYSDYWGKIKVVLFNHFAV